ncbi:MAG: rhomboid family intramembrane serine protease [Cyanobacteria bacterium P01_D01_bin.36]
MFNSKSQVIFLYLVLGVAVMVLYTKDPSWQGKLEVLRDSVILTWTASLMNLLLFGNGLGRLFGIRPRQAVGLLGIPFSPLFHRDLGHLLANTVPFLVLGWLILVQGELEGAGEFYTITVTILLIGGLGTWLFGREAIHMGASGLIFGYIGFLLISGYEGPTLLTVGFAAIVFLMYGNQLWSMLPSSNESKVSWEGHLFGFAGGVVAGSYPNLLLTITLWLESLVQ